MLGRPAPLHDMSENDNTKLDPGLKSMVVLGAILGVFSIILGAFLQTSFGT